MSPGVVIRTFLKPALAAIVGILILCGWLSLDVRANPTTDGAVTLKNNNYYRNLATDVSYYEDKTKELKPQAAVHLDRRRVYRPIRGNLIDFGFSYSAFWLRVPLQNATSKDGKWILTLDVPNINEITVYLHRHDRGAAHALQRIYSLADGQPFSSRTISHRNLATPFELKAGERVEVLVRYVSKLSTQLPLFVESPDHYYARIGAEDAHNWSVFALLAGMTLVSTIFLMALGFSTAGFYGAYILASAFYLFHTDGYAFQYLWPGSPAWNNQAIALIGMAMVITGSLFARAFTDAPQYHPRLNRILLSTVSVALLLACISVVGLGYQSFKTATLLFVVWAALLYLLAGILSARRGQAGSNFFICGASAVISSIIMGATGYLNPGLFNQDIAGHFGRYALLLEGTAFALAILANILSLRNERDTALRREVATAQEKLALSEALVAAERSHSHALALAETRRERLASTAHDLQQPLSSLRIAVSRLGDRDDAATRQVHASFDYLDRLVLTGLEDSYPADPLDHHARVEEPLRDSDLETFPVSIVLQNVAAMFRDEAAAKGLELRFVSSEVLVQTPPLVLMRVISNLLSNAIKYTDKGKVLFGCRRRGQSLRIEVYDTGPGMPKDIMDRLMLPYARAGNGAGTGLGLPLVKELSETSGYEFELNSVPGTGTRARICLPRSVTT